MLGPEHAAWNTRNVRNKIGVGRFILRLANYRRSRCPQSWAHPIGGRSPFRVLPFALPLPPLAAVLQTATLPGPAAASWFPAFPLDTFHPFRSLPTSLN